MLTVLARGKMLNTMRLIVRTRELRILYCALKISDDVQYS